MKRIDRLILKEIISPWVFGVALFTVLLLAAGPLNRITSYLVGGAAGATVGQLVLLYLPQLLVKTFSMSMLLAGLLGFGRLSSDSEIIALKASGASVVRIIAPVFAASLVVSIVTFFFNDTVVPKASRTAVSLVTQLAQSGKIGGKANAQPIIQDGKVVAMLNAVKADLATKTLSGVTVIAYDEKQLPAYILFAPTVVYNGPDDWKIEGEARITDANDPRIVVQLHGGAWPSNVPHPHGTLENLLVKKDDYDSYTIKELKEKIAQMKRDRDTEMRDIRDYEYGFYNKYSVAFAALIFGTLGAVLGIQNRRTGSASGFALAVAIIFGYVALANFMNEWARGGLLPPWAASFAPLCIGALACGVIIYRRNS